MRSQRGLAAREPLAEPASSSSPGVDYPAEEREITAAPSARGWVTRDDRRQRHVRGAPRRHGARLGRRRHLRRRHQLRRRRPRRTPGAVPCPRRDHRRLGRRQRRRARRRQRRGTQRGRPRPAHLARAGDSGAFRPAHPARARGGHPPPRDPGALGDRSRAAHLRRGGRRSRRRRDRRSARGRGRHARAGGARAARPYRRERRGDARRRPVPVAQRAAARGDRPRAPHDRSGPLRARPTRRRSSAQRCSGSTPRVRRGGGAGIGCIAQRRRRPLRGDAVAPAGDGIPASPTWRSIDGRRPIRSGDARLPRHDRPGGRCPRPAHRRRRVRRPRRPVGLGQDDGAADARRSRGGRRRRRS